MRDRENARFDFTTEDDEAKLKSLAALITKWLGPATLDPVQVPMDLGLPHPLRLYYETVSQWPEQDFGDFFRLYPPEIAARARPDGLIAFACDDHGGFEYTTEPLQQGGSVWLDEPKSHADQQAPISTCLTDELVRFTLTRLILCGSSDEVAVNPRALQPELLNGSLRADWIDFKDNDGAFTPFVLVEDDLLLSQVDVNGRAFGAFAIRAGTADKWESRLSGQLSAVQIHTCPSTYVDDAGQPFSSPWLLDINPDGSGHFEHGATASHRVRQWFRPGTVDARQLSTTLGGDRDAECPIALIYDGDDRHGAISKFEAQAIFTVIIESLDLVSPDVAQRLESRPKPAP